MTEIKKSEICNISEMMKIYAEARQAIAELGIDQWQPSFPPQSIIEDDINEQCSYSVFDDGKLIGVFYITDRRDPTYDTVYNGQWKCNEDKPYIVVHRVAFGDSARGKGISKIMFDFAYDCAKEKGCKSVRLDTHEGNARMRRALSKNGFEYCGIILLVEGTATTLERVAYEKKIIY